MVRAAMYENSSLIVVTIDGQCHISQILDFVWSAVISLFLLHNANDVEPVWQNKEKLYHLRSVKHHREKIVHIFCHLESRLEPELELDQ